MIDRSNGVNSNDWNDGVLLWQQKIWDDLITVRLHGHLIAENYNLLVSGIFRNSHFVSIFCCFVIPVKSLPWILFYTFTLSYKGPIETCASLVNFKCLFFINIGFDSKIIIHSKFELCIYIIRVFIFDIINLPNHNEWFHACYSTCKLKVQLIFITPF